MDSFVALGRSRVVEGEDWPNKGREDPRRKQKMDYARNGNGPKLIHARHTNCFAQVQLAQSYLYTARTDCAGYTCNRYYKPPNAFCDRLERAHLCDTSRSVKMDDSNASAHSLDDTPTKDDTGAANNRNPNQQSFRR